MLLAGRVLFLIVLAWRAGAAPPEVLAGNLRMPLADGFAISRDFFGKQCLEIYFFSTKLDASAKAALAREERLDFKIARAVTGAAPVLNMMFFFQPDARVCSMPKLLSYTAVFQKTPEFPFDAATDIPLNLATGGGNYGIATLTCGFEKGAQVRLKVKKSWNATRSMFPKLLPPGRQAMTFTWDVDFSGEIAKAR